MDLSIDLAIYSCMGILEHPRVYEIIFQKAFNIIYSLEFDWFEVFYI